MRLNRVLHPVVSTVIVFVILLAATSFLAAYSSGPPNVHTGAPGESTCATSGCHTGNALNESGGSLTISGIPTAGFELGQTYPVTISLSRTGQARWGFEAVVKDANGQQAGSVTITDMSRTQSSVSSGLSYVKHTSGGTSSGTWTFNWQAPQTDVGTVTFYAAGNAANGNGGSSGDYIYTTALTANASVTAVEQQGRVPFSFRLHGNYPNPFNPATTIRFEIDRPGLVKVVVYDVAGRQVRELLNRNLTAGMHEALWDGRVSNGNIATSGVYFVRIKSMDRSAVSRMLLVK